MQARVFFLFFHFVLHFLALAGSGSAKKRKFKFFIKIRKIKKVWNAEGVEAHVKMACRPDKVGQEVEVCVCVSLKKKTGRKIEFEKKHV
jgi:hypothetical protein